MNLLKVSCFAALLLGVLGLVREAEAKLVLGKIVVHGASKTTPGAVESRMRLHEGDTVEFGILGVAEERLVASDLFKSVKIGLDLPREYATRLMYLDDNVYSIDVHVTVEEKHSWFVFPNAAFGGGDKAAGVVYGDQNFLGHGVQVITAAQLGESKSFAFLGFRDPIMTFAPVTYSLAGVYRVEDFRFFEAHRKVLEIPTEIVGGEAQVGYVFSSHMRALVGGLYNRQWVQTARDFDPLDSNPLYNNKSGNIVVLQLYVIYDRTSAPEGLRRGSRIWLKNEVSDRFWSSDFDYAKLDFQAELYGYFHKTYPSAVFRSVLNYPTSERGVPLTQMLRAGGGALRGYLVNEFRGDTLLTMQLEDQIPILKGIQIPLTSQSMNLAIAGFIDTGALLERHPGGQIATLAGAQVESRPKLDDFHSSVGLGLRLLVPGVAIPALKIDYAYGIDVRDSAFTISVAGGGL